MNPYVKRGKLSTDIPPEVFINTLTRETNLEMNLEDLTINHITINKLSSEEILLNNINL